MRNKLWLLLLFHRKSEDASQRFLAGLEILRNFMSQRALHRESQYPSLEKLSLKTLFLRRKNSQRN